MNGLLCGQFLKLRVKEGQFCGNLYPGQWMDNKLGAFNVESIHSYIFSHIFMMGHCSIESLLHDTVTSGYQTLMYCLDTPGFQPEMYINQPWYENSVCNIICLVSDCNI